MGVYSVEMLTTNLMDILNRLESRNSIEDILILIAVEALLWSIFSLFLTLFLPKRYKPYKFEIFIFFLVINIGLLFIGFILTIIMVLFGLSWATHRVSRPIYEAVQFEEETEKFPMVYSKFQEGILSMEGSNRERISSDEKIKSLKILYDSNAQGNIGRIKRFLSDSSDETRLYAFALVSTFEKKLNDLITELQRKIEDAKGSRLEQYQFELANTYWQFIFHGVADEQLAGFYTTKIENILKDIKSNASAFMLLGKIHLFNKRYEEAERAFLRAMELGVPKKATYTFLAEIKFGLKKYNEVNRFILKDEFNIDLRLKPLITMWESR
ncbi:MAG: hypothetical protein GXO06_01095 [Epsilonproteobacteria bacterium]|jgi:tetratricopeptide (TPR) repeat protein|nr:hypothetical protein [Campylobacterota bacterium]